MFSDLSLDDIDFTSQSSMFPDVPPDQNPFLLLVEDIDNLFYPNVVHMDAMLAQSAASMAVLILGIIALVAILVYSYLIARKTSQPLSFIRRIVSNQGTYFTIDTRTFTPISMLSFWIMLLAQSTQVLHVNRLQASQLYIFLCKDVPYLFMFVQGHFFSFSVLVGGAITSSELITRSAKKRNTPHPLMLNALQLVAAVIVIVVLIIFIIFANSMINHFFRESENVRKLARELAKTWYPFKVYDPAETRPLFERSWTLLSVLLKAARKYRQIWIVWVVLCAIPIVVLLFAGAMLIYAIRHYIESLLIQGTAPIPMMTLTPRASSAQQPQIITSTPRTSSVQQQQLQQPHAQQPQQSRQSQTTLTLRASLVLQSQARHPTIHQEQTHQEEAGFVDDDVEELRRYGLFGTLTRLRLMERNLMIRISFICFISFSYLAVYLVLIVMFTDKSKTYILSHWARLYILQLICFTWMSIVYGSIVIVGQLFDRRTEYKRIIRATTNRMFVFDHMLNVNRVRNDGLSLDISTIANTEISHPLPIYNAEIPLVPAHTERVVSFSGAADNSSSVKDE